MKSLLLLSISIFFSVIQAEDKSFKQQVDEVFSHIDPKTQPGCSVGVFEDGEIIHKAGYGLANIHVFRRVKALADAA